MFARWLVLVVAVVSNVFERSEATPAKLMTTATGQAANHEITASVLFDWAMTFWTWLRLLLQIRFVGLVALKCDCGIVLIACQSLMPDDIVFVARLGSTRATPDEWILVTINALLAIAAARIDTPSKGWK